MTLTSATHLYNHSLAFDYDKTDEIIELHFQGCKFNIHDGILGFVHPVIGWFAVVDFKHDCKQDAIESIQWVLDEYGMNYIRRDFRASHWMLHLQRRDIGVEKKKNY